MGCLMWRDAAVKGSKIHDQVVGDGFILTEGDSGYSGGGIEVSTVYLPTFNLLQVHKRYPFKVSDSGRGLVVRPVGDKRPMEQIVRSSDPKVYDSVSFVLWPRAYYPYCDSESRATVLRDSSFIDLSKVKGGVVLDCFSGACVNEDGIDKYSVIPPSQIYKQFDRWINNLRRNIFGHNKEGDKREMLGVMSIDESCLCLDVGRMLERRLGVNIFPKDRLRG
jgi:hypothetical protein